jgi:signal transduction histidine kinase
MVKGITARFALLVATAAVLPLIAYGLVSITSLRTGTRQSVLAGNMSIASRAASQIELSIGHSVGTLRALAADLKGTYLEPWQQDRILRNYVLAFPEFRSITVFDADGAVVASSRVDRRSLAVDRDTGAGDEDVVMSPIRIDDDLLPEASVRVRIDSAGGTAGWLSAELRLEEMWRLIDRIRIGRLGYALLVDDTGRLIAHGEPEGKPSIARGEDALWHPLTRETLRQESSQPRAVEHRDRQGRQLLAVGVPLHSLKWALIVEQPTSEAYALATRLERQLLVVIGMALFITIALGYYWGRSFIEPILALMHGTRALAEGHMDTRVRIDRDDEFRALGDGFNRMADRLVELQQDARKQERQAMFGRIAAGLVHDLAHPIQNVGNNCRLILQMYEDVDYRETFRRTVERELATVKRVLEDLRNLARPIPLERFPIELGRSVAETVESMSAFAEAAGVDLEFEAPDEPTFVLGDVFALGRVYRNLILNAIQATAPGGVISVAVGRVEGRARVVVSDTGCGIPPDRLTAIFDDFVTTKRRGLGLGLAIARKIVEQLDGTISAASEVARGTSFVIELPQTTARPLLPGLATGPRQPVSAEGE